MGAGKHTTALGLPLWQDADKPTWRGDLNDAMSRVDAFAIEARAGVAAAIAKADGAVANHDGIVTDAANAAKAATQAELDKLKIKLPRTVLTIGDSYGTGCQEGGAPYITPMGDLIAELLNKRDGAGHWAARNYCVDNSGYMVAGRDANFVTMAERAKQQGVADVDAVIIVGGRNDRGANVTEAVVGCVARIRELYPNAKVVCLPLWSWERLDADYYVTLTSILYGAAKVGAVCDEGSVLLCSSWPRSEWSGVHPGLGVARVFAGAAVALLSGGSLIRSHTMEVSAGTSLNKRHARLSYDLSGVRLEISGNLSTANPVQPLFGRLPQPIVTPGRVLYVYGMSQSGAGSGLCMVGVDGDIKGRETFTGEAGSYMQLVVSWPHGMSEN